MILTEIQQEKTKRVMFQFYINHHFYLSDVAAYKQHRLLTWSLAAFVAVLLIMVFTINVGKLFVVALIIVMIAFNWVLSLIRRNTDRNNPTTPTRKQVELRFKEIDIATVWMEERDLFVQVVDVLSGERDEDLKALMEEIMKSPRLAGLAFVRELDAGLNQMLK